MNQNFDIIPVPISLRDTEGHYLYVNKAWCEMFSMDVERALGYTDNELNLAPLAFPKGEPGSPVGEYSFRDVFITTRDKGRLLIEMIETRIDEETGSSSILCVHQDMTGIGWRMEDMSRSIHRSENRIKQLTQHASRLVRESREPVGQILTFCEKLGKTTLDNKQRGMLAIVRDSARLVHKQLELDTGSFTYDEELLSNGDEPVIMEPLMQEVVRLYEKVSHDKGITLETSISPELDVPVVTDRSHLRQIIVNLIESAIRTAKEGTVTLHAQMIQDSASPLFLKVGIEKPKLTDRNGNHTEASDISIGLSHKILRGLCGIVGGRFEICNEKNGARTLRVFLRAAPSSNNIT
jgi:signal transduction histidine kinase